MSASAAPPSVPLRHLDELADITREYAALTSGGAGAWTWLGLSAWMAGAELLHRLGTGWGALAYLALPPLAIVLGLLELRISTPHGAVEAAPRDRWDRVSRLNARWAIGLLAFAGEWLALFALYLTLQEIRWMELPLAAWLAALVVFPALAAAPVAAPFLLRGRLSLLAAVGNMLILAQVGINRLTSPRWAQRTSLALLAGAALMALLSLAALGFRRWQLRHLDRRMAALRGRLL